jgi:hypothetical protein
VNEPRQHHYVSRCYLKRFATPPDRDSQLFCVDSKTKRSFRTTPLNIAKERDFNRIEAEGINPNALEEGLAEFEGKLDAALDRITQTSEAIKTSDDFDCLMNLMALLGARNPRFRRTFGDFQQDVMKAAIHLTFATKERWEIVRQQMKAAGYNVEFDDYDILKEYIERDEYTVHLRREFFIASELHVIEPILRCLVDRNWTFVHATQETGYFLTCDHPLRLVWSNPDLDDSIYSPGFGLRGTDVLFPITKEMAVIGRFDGPGRHFNATMEQIASINSQTMGNAERQIYAADSSVRFETNRGVRTLEDLVQTWARLYPAQ